MLYEHSQHQPPPAAVAPLPPDVICHTRTRHAAGADVTAHMSSHPTGRRQPARLSGMLCGDTAAINRQVNHPEQHR